jgi:hypothetical protein
MSSYSQYGYTVSASTDAYTNGSFKAWRAFNNTIGNEGWHAGEYNDGVNWDATFNGTDNAYSGTRSLGGVSGEWLKLELPFRLKLSYLMLASRDTSSNPQNQGPQDLVMMGSNDDVNWTTIKTVTGLTPAPDNEYDTIVTNAQKAYKYIAMVCTKVFGAGGFLSVGELRYFGHKENDTTRFPVSSTVLKYPHVAMTGQPGTSQNVSDLQHAQRGYEVTASSMYVNNASNPYQPWRAFNGVTNGTWFSRGLTNLYGGTDNTYGSVANANLGTDSGGSATHGGEWLKLKLPRTLVLNRIVMYTSGSEAPEDFTLYGSNDGSSWTEILSETGLAATSGGATYTPSSTPSAYKYFGLVITKTVSRNNYAGIRELELYGTEPEDVVARVGEGLDGKVANFRVYDKYLHEEQALELWDAQKDQFGRAESSVVVHKGRLGVGTTEPEGRFAVLDEPGDMEEFPPRAMTDYETYMEGHGVFRASASEEYTKTIAGNASGDEAWKMFDKQNTNWTGGNSYTGTSNTYAGTHTSGGYGGDYIELKLPYKIKLEEFIIQPSSGLLNRWSKSGVIVAKNTNDDAWTNIFSWSGSSVASSDKYNSVYFRDVDTSNAFDTFRLVITSVDSQPYVTLFQWRLFGTREQGQSTLHDGSLTLTKNLTVPRIGPALDADDTPRRDRLVVEYNTSTNPTANGTVKDTSGRGLDGLLYGASYDATEKALVFDGTDDYIKVDDTGIRGDYIHSVSFWIYNDNYNINPFWIGENLDGKRINVYITAPQIDYSFRGDTVTTTLVPPINRWWHLTLTYNGTQGINGRKIYIDGVEQTTTHSGTAAALNIVDGVMYLGTNFQQASDLNGKMSSLKFYDVALTATEVKRLYDMGRCDEGHHVVNFSKTRVGIGLGDGEAPRADLDVRGDLHANGSVVQLQTRTFCLSFSSTSTTFTDTGAYVDITPKFSNSKFFVMFDGLVYISANVASGFGIKAFRSIGGGADQRVYSAIGLAGAAASPHDLALYNANGAYQHARISLSFSDTPNTSSSIRYKIYARSHVSGTTVNLGNSGHQPLTFSVFEIGQ